MLLMQEPQLLLLDEPVAGMTDEETERTAELFLSLAGKHSLVVVEHDMDFIAQIARKVTVLHEGSVLAEGPMDDGAERPAGDRSVPGALRRIAMLTVDEPQPVLRRQPHPARRRVRGAVRRSARRCSAATAWARPRC